MMKLITILFITAGWVVSLVPLIIITASYLADNNTGLALCFVAIILFMSGQFVNLLLNELETCPYDEPLHDHHDGCPSCYSENNTCN